MKLFEGIKKIHFIGIGGVGVSAMAKLARDYNITVTGSDVQTSSLTKDLEDNYEAQIFIGARAENIHVDHDLVVYSPAIPASNIEYKEALNYDIPLMSYPELLGKISAIKKTIAVSGTNGKTTTTAMIIEVMKHLGADPSGIVGALLQKYDSNYVSGQSDFFITEACEYKESFLNIYYDILVVTNITEDHLDYFSDLAHIQDTFKKFLKNHKKDGVLVCNTDQPHLLTIINEAKKENITIIDYRKHLTKDLTLSLPGEHNLQNAAATLGVIEALGLSLVDAREYLAKYFQGVQRRMEHVGMTTSGIQIFDDYAHNPEGLTYLIKGLRDFYPDKKIIMLFEPHLYSRTRDFKNEFAQAVEKVDILYLFPTYRAREDEIPQENYLLEQYIDTSKVELITVSETNDFIKQFKSMQFNNKYIVVSAGAGDIWKFSHALKNNSL
ncbi:MAG: UDP-N-acetylmuramate--alanine ligase [Crocinitomicaceae bacterium]|jgi:UDP-N-acetylmuramate--alanine ligase